MVRVAVMALRHARESSEVTPNPAAMTNPDMLLKLSAEKQATAAAGVFAVTWSVDTVGKLVNMA